LPEAAFAAAAPLLELRGVSRSYGGVPASAAVIAIAYGE
jgi:hypothetical protein